MANTQESNIEFGKRFDEEWSAQSEEDINAIAKKDGKKEKKAARKEREKERDTEIAKLQSQVRRQRSEIRELKRQAQYPVAQRVDNQRYPVLQTAEPLRVGKIESEPPMLKEAKSAPDREPTMIEGLAQGTKTIQKTAEAGLYSVAGFAAAGPVGALAGYGIGRYGPALTGAVGGRTLGGAAKVGALIGAGLIVPQAMPLAAGLVGYNVIKGGINKLRGKNPERKAA
jgi:hypothetical protein